ncbi:MAG: VWA domain-containing protein [Candidatus Helarchaeota archaeon]
MSDVDILDVEDTVLCIDISRSMARKDLGNRSRLDIVKDALINFVKAKLKIDKRDRFAIVGFSTNASVLLQLTNNEEEIIAVIESLKPQGISELGAGIAVSLNILCHEILQEGQNVNRILIISDGKPWLGTIDPIEKANMAAELGIIIDSIEISRSREEWGENILESMAQLGTYHQIMSEDLLKLPLQTLTHKKDVYDMKKEMPKLSLIATPLIDPKDLPPEMKESIDFYLGEKEPTCIICRLSGCEICHQEFDCFRICPYCKNYMHLCCVEKWAESSKMIEAQVFRCPHCLMLLRLPESAKKPKIELPPPIEETNEESDDSITITSAFSENLKSQDRQKPQPKQSRIRAPSAYDAKIGQFVREGGRILLKEVIKGEEKLLYLAWDNWGSRNYNCNLMSGMNEKICKEFLPIIDWEKKICTGFTITDTIGWLSNLSYEYGILILNLDELSQWCKNVLSDIENIKKLIESHPEIKFLSDKLTDFELSATVKFDDPINISNRDELEGNLLIGAVTYLHLFHNASSQYSSKKVEVPEVESNVVKTPDVSRTLEINESEAQNLSKEFSIDFGQMDEPFEQKEQNIVVNQQEEETKKEVFRYHCENCNKWFKSDRLIQQNCPSCSSPLKLGLYCPKCKKWYFVDIYGKYKCPQCGTILQTDE